MVEKKQEKKEGEEEKESTVCNDSWQR